MKPIKFDEANTVFNENGADPTYPKLYAFKAEQDGLYITAWELSIWERLSLLFTGRLWLRLLTFGEPLQKHLPEIKKPFTKD